MSWLRKDGQQVDHALQARQLDAIQLKNAVRDIERVREYVQIVVSL
jgi:hypothetical protein